MKLLCTCCLAFCIYFLEITFQDLCLLLNCVIMFPSVRYIQGLKMMIYINILYVKTHIHLLLNIHFSNSIFHSCWNESSFNLLIFLLLCRRFFFAQCSLIFLFFLLFFTYYIGVISIDLLPRPMYKHAISIFKYIDCILTRIKFNICIVYSQF